MTIRFPHTSLGKVPPRLGGVKFHQASHRDEIIVDMDIQYAGDLVVGIEATLIDDRLPPVMASLCNLTMPAARLRVHLRPLLADVKKIISTKHRYVQICFSMLRCLLWVQ